MPKISSVLVLFCTTMTILTPAFAGFPNATPHEKTAFIAGWTLSALNILETIDAYACAISGTTPTPNGYDNARVSLEHYTGLTT